MLSRVIAGVDNVPPPIPFAFVVSNLLLSYLACPLV